MSNYQALAEHAIKRISDHHDATTEALLVVDVRQAIEKAVAEATRPEAVAWKRVNAPMHRQIAWIDGDAKYVAVVEGGQEFLLQLPSRDAAERDSPKGEK